MTAHALHQTTQRLRDAGIEAPIIAKIYRAAEGLAALSSVGAEAIRLLKLSAQVNQAYGLRSNGDEVWAIIRNRQLKTVMLRRSSQPQTPAAFRVEKVTVLPG